MRILRCLGHEVRMLKQLLGIMVVAGCAAPLGTSSVHYDIRGEVRAEIYTSPDGDFRVRVPPLVKPGARIRDGLYAPDRFSVEFSDDFCRVYVIARRPGELADQSLESWFDEVLAPELKQKPGLVLLERENVSTKLGVAVLQFATQAEGAPCVRQRGTTEGFVEEKPDAELAMYILHRGKHFYQVMYVLGEGVPGFILPTRPVKGLLDQFFEGFELLPSEVDAAVSSQERKALIRGKTDFLRGDGVTAWLGSLSGNRKRG